MRTVQEDQLNVVRALAERRDVAGLVEELVEISTVVGGYWRHDGGLVLAAVRTLDEPARGALALALDARAAALPPGDQRGSLNMLVPSVASESTAAADPDVAEALLRAGGRQVTWPTEPLLTLVGVLHTAGRAVPDEAVALVRRSALANYGATALKDLARTLPGPPVSCGEAWAERARDDLTTLDPAWAELVAHAATATSARPTAAWESRARTLLAALPPEDGDPGARLRDWLALVGRPRTFPLDRPFFGYDVNDAYDPHNATVLRGLVWLAPALPEHPDTARVLGALVTTSLRKVAGLGPRSPKIANAAVQALARTGTPAALGQIARLTARVTYKGTLKELSAALEATAQTLGLTRDEVEELAVPTYGLSEVGRRVETLGEATATLRVVGGRAALSWRNGAGREVKAPPAAVRAGHPEELKELKASAKDVDQMLTAQAERLDRQFLARRSWAFGTWRERYLDHTLLGTLARRVIWLVDGRPAGFADGALRDAEDRPVTDGSSVELWHPVGRPAEETQAWRAWLERHEITQPFKQAHREVYPLTAAEETTGTYSNRFAAHVLRQHQLHALAAVRGWDDRLRLMVDDSYPPTTRHLPGWGLRAELWVEGIGESYGEDTTESGAYLRLSTDQVRFYASTAPENRAHAGGGGYAQWLRGGGRSADPLPLAGIPPLVLSEVMRDVDLFVGVASVGNDPTWQDGGPGGRFRTYWESYSFGELTATAQTRRDVLERLVPRLAIADRARVSGRFLEVRGNLRTYRIHLGSGNVLMSPNDEYLCIVPKQAPVTTGPVFLPFDGDRVLAVVLSKALLLAKDDEIADPTIVRQIDRHPVR